MPRSILDFEEIMRRPAQDENAPAGALKSPERMAQERQQQAWRSPRPRRSICRRADPGENAQGRRQRVKDLAQAGQSANDNGAGSEAA
jgi:hypothetical protein